MLGGKAGGEMVMPRARGTGFPRGRLRGWGCHRSTPQDTVVRGGVRVSSRVGVRARARARVEARSDTVLAPTLHPRNRPNPGIGPNYCYDA